MSSLKRRYRNDRIRQPADSRVPCHDVALADIEDALAESHTDVETLKRSTAVYMGPCQGK